MAVSERTTLIHNPARGPRKRRNVARRMTLKQKLHFGSKRVRAAAKQALRARRHNATPKRHKVHRRRTQAAPRRKKATRRNMGEVVYVLGANPAKSRKGNMAKSRRRSSQHRAGSRKQKNPRRRRHVMNVSRRRGARRNPGGKVMGYVVRGAAVIAGAVGSKAATQLVLSSKNTGVMGYAGNAIATGILGFAAHKMFADKTIAQMVIAGGIAQIIVRIMSDQTPYGSYLSGAGVGDTRPTGISALRSASRATLPRASFRLQVGARQRLRMPL